MIKETLPPPPHYKQSQAATEKDADVCVTGIVGCAGLVPTVEAIKAKKTIALANKETLISGGPAILPLLKEHGVNVIPADSEHSAIFQSLQVRFLWLAAAGVGGGGGAWFRCWRGTVVVNDDDARACSPLALMTN